MTDFTEHDLKIHTNIKNKAIRDIMGHITFFLLLIFSTTLSAATFVEGTTYSGSSAATTAPVLASGQDSSGINRSLKTSNTGVLSVDGSASTQPVSIATMPSTPVTGTFFQAIQPVSGTVSTGGLTNSELRASAVSVSLPGVATSALQTTGNVSLGSIASSILDQSLYLEALNFSIRQDVDPFVQSIAVGAKNKAAGDLQYGLEMRPLSSSPISTDKALIVTVGSSSLPTNAATATLQATGNTFLSGISTNTLNIDSATTVLAGAVDSLGNDIPTSARLMIGTLNKGVSPNEIAGFEVRPLSSAPISTDKALIVTVGSSSLPTGAAKESKQDTGNASLNSIDSKFTTLNAKDFATSAKQDTGNSSLGSILSAVTGVSTSSNQVLANTYLNSIDAKNPALVSGRVPVDGSGVTQPISGSVTATISGAPNVSVLNFPSVQTVYSASLPLPQGASTEATLALIKAKTDNIDVALSTRTKPADSQTITGTITANAGTNLNTSTLALESGGNLATLAGKDFATQTTLSLLNNKLNSLGQKTSANSMPFTLASDQSIISVSGPLTDAQLRATSINTNMAQLGGTNIVNAGVAGVLAVGGNIAHSTAATTNPAQIGGRVVTTTETTLANGDTSYLNFTTAGQVVTKMFSTAENDWSYTSSSTPILTTNTTQIIAAGAANVRNYITDCSFQNNNAVRTTAAILDGASNEIWRTDLSASMVAPISTGNGVTPLKGSTATAMNIKLGTTAARVNVNCRGYQSF